MLSNNRVIWSDNGVLKDISAKMNNLFNGSVVMDFNADEDFIYIGSDVPFNHRWFKVDVPNSEAVGVEVEIWDGNEWVFAVDVVDFTNQENAPTVVSMSRSGIVKWVTDKTKTWAKEKSTEDMTGSGLSTLKIYDMYWIRLAFDDLTSTTMELSYIGHKFSSDEDLRGHYPDLGRSNVMTAFSAGKTDWDDQHVLAAEAIVSDLRVLRGLWSPGQIFEWEPFCNVAIHKVAEIIYTAFGAKYEDRRDDARAAYKEALEAVMDIGQDDNEDGHVDEEEHQGYESGVLVRR